MHTQYTDCKDELYDVCATAAYVSNSRLSLFQLSAQPSVLLVLGCDLSAMGLHLRSYKQYSIISASVQYSVVVLILYNILSYSIVVFHRTIMYTVPTVPYSTYTVQYLLTVVLVGLPVLLHATGHLRDGALQLGALRLQRHAACL